MNREKAVGLVLEDVDMMTSALGPFHDCFQAYGVLNDEMENLRLALMRADTPERAALVERATVRVASAAVRLLRDVV